MKQNRKSIAKVLKLFLAIFMLLTCIHYSPAIFAEEDSSSDISLTAVNEPSAKAPKPDKPAKQITVTYYSNNKGTVISSETVDAGSTVIVRGDDFSHDNAKPFVGWVYSYDDAGVKDKEGVVNQKTYEAILAKGLLVGPGTKLENLQKDITLYAVFTQKQNITPLYLVYEWTNAPSGVTLPTDDTVYYSGYPYEAETSFYNGYEYTTNEGTYTFSGWEPTTGTFVDSDVTITGSWTFVPNIETYTVTWVDEDGTELEVDTDVEEGTMPSYDGTEPSKAATAQYTYTFAGWTPTVVSVTGDATYTATYTETVNTYTVTWLDEDGSELEVDTDVEYGATPSYDGTEPTKAATAQNTYTFAGWTPELSEVTGDATYTATYTETVNTYTVTWLDEDGTELEVDTDVEYGATPSYDGTEPTKAATAQYTYTFTGWTPELSEVTGDATYIATYTETVNTYTVTWIDEDGTELEVDTDVEYGATPSYDGAEPTKAATAQYTYTFADWAPGVSAVTGDVTYTAVYDETVNKYTVIFEDYNGKELSNKTYEYGATVEKTASPTRPSTSTVRYEFVKWTPTVATTVTEDARYVAVYKTVEITTPSTDPEPTPGPRPDTNRTIVPNTPETPTTPEVEVPEVEVEEETTPEVTPETPEVEVEPDVTPEVNKGSWALLNLISTVVGAIGAIALLFAKHEKEEDEEDGEEGTPQTRNRVWKVVSPLVAVGSVIAFVLTENMKLQMVLTDKYTLLMVALVVVNLGSLYFGTKWHEKEDEEAEA